MNFHFGKKGLISGLVLFVLLGMGCGAWYYYAPNQVSEVKEEVIEIRSGDTGSEIAEHLYEKGLISSTTAFRVALRIHGVMDKLQQGYYQMPNNLSLSEVIEKLQQGDVKTIRVTIPEGFNIREIASRMETQGFGSAKDFLTEAETFAPYDYMYGAKPVQYRSEGFLFPATYDFPLNASPKEVQAMMAKEMNAKLTKELEPRLNEFLKAHNMSVFDFVVLASLVEKEAFLDEDRPLIAAAFLKRLQIQMPLQSCASIEYLLGTRKPVLSLEDIQVESPYNTYLNAGLPPGPIANPGMKSMRAVLDAKATEDIFFVADTKGRHHFSKTYEEHLEKIESIYGKQ